MKRMRMHCQNQDRYCGHQYNEERQNLGLSANQGYFSLRRLMTAVGRLMMLFYCLIQIDIVLPCQLLH